MTSFMIGLIRENFVEFLAILLSVVGGVVGLRQWIKGNDYKRAEIAKGLINQIRDDKEIASIMDAIDWSNGFIYDGKFHFISSEGFENIVDERKLFVAVDRTLAHFNYICYLRSLGIFKRKDMIIFEYAIQRIFSNEHILNYLHSLGLWSEKNSVSCSYTTLIDYGKKMNYVEEDFCKRDAEHYKCYLVI